jgi:Homeodomain-like domain
MRGPKPLALTVTDTQRQALEQFVRRHTTPQQLALRARIILAADTGLNNAQIARLLNLQVDTVRTWRSRWLACQPVSLADLPLEERLADAPRSGKPTTITAQQVCQIIALACEPPAEGGRPISHWSSRELADEIIARKIVPAISRRHASRLLKRGISNRT